MIEKVYTTAELAEVFGRSRQTIHNWIVEGRFPNYIKTGENTATILVPAADVERVRKEEVQELVDRLQTLGFQSELVPA
jgi:hypothetical protein